jgi:RHS repeat-associated protein
VYTYDALGQVVSGRRYWSDGWPVAGQQFEYAFDDIGNRRTTATGGDEWGVNLRTETYAATDLNQYSQRTESGYVEVMGSAHSNATVTVNLQPTVRKGEYFRGELRAENTGGPVWLNVTNVGVLANAGTGDMITTNAGTVLVAPRTEIFAYDSDGNLVTNGLREMAWNGENRMTNAQSGPAVATGARTRVGYGYDGRGRRVWKVVSTNSGAAWVTVQTNLFVYDGWNLVAELNGPNQAVLRTYGWGLDLSGTPQGAGGVGGLLMVNGQGEGVHFVAHDANGNVSALCSAASGAQTARYVYSPLGELLEADGPLARRQPFRFSTKYHDEETGTYYYGYRDYEPETGRWLSRDPIGEEGGANLFALVDNCPINFVDRLGMDRFRAVVVGKSFIAKLGPQKTPIPTWVPKGQEMAESLYGLNENPQSDTKDGQYRLYSRLSLFFECCGEYIAFEAKKLVNTSSGIGGTFESDGGQEIAFFKGTINGAIGFKKESDSKWLFSVDVAGAPNPTVAEITFQVLKPRRSWHIWHSIRGYIRCDENGVGRVYADIYGSAFPSHSLWINGALDKTLNQGDISNLWAEHPSLPGFVR